MSNPVQDDDACKLTNSSACQSCLYNSALPDAAQQETAERCLPEICAHYVGAMLTQDSRERTHLTSLAYLTSASSYANELVKRLTRLDSPRSRVVALLTLQKC